MCAQRWPKARFISFHLLHTNVRPNDVDRGSCLSSDENSSELARISTSWFWSVSGDQHIASGMGVLQKTPSHVSIRRLD